MAITKQGGHSSTATERMKAARAVKRDAVKRELRWVSIASRFWPSCLMPPRNAQSAYPWICIIDSPAGRIAYRVSAEEVPLFDHLKRKRNDGVEARPKLDTLTALAMDGWKE